MQFSFEYGCRTLNFDVEDDNLLYYAQLGDLQPASSEVDELIKALDNPLGTPKLKDQVDPSDQVVIVADDLTRATPQKKLLPPLLDYLNDAGVPDSNIKVVIALGTHRPMSPQEIVDRFGSEVVSRVPVENHDFQDPTKNIYLGKTQSGTVVELNRDVYEADLRILVGMVMPHPLAGWGGGAKMIQPGVCSEKTTESTHFIGGTYPEPLQLPGNPESPVRAEIEVVAGRVGPVFLVNTVLNHSGKLVKCFAGHYIQAHRAAVKLAEKLFRPNIPGLADVVIYNAFPCDRDFWQGFKPFYYANLGVKPGGTIVFAISAPEGVSGDAPEHTNTVLSWSTQDPQLTLEALEQGVIADRIAGSVCVAHARLLERAQVICVSDGMSAGEIRSLGFEPAASMQEAIEMATYRHGSQATFGVVPYGGITLVKL